MIKLTLNSDSPLWKDSNELNFSWIGSWDADFSTSYDPIWPKFSSLESSQRGESEFNIGFIIILLVKKFIFNNYYIIYLYIDILLL